MSARLFSEGGRRRIASTAASILSCKKINLRRDDACALTLINDGYPAAVVGVVLDDAIAIAGKSTREVAGYE